MIKNKFIKNTIILAIGSLITKALGFVIRIIFTRVIGKDGINLYSLIMPTYMLFITIATCGLPLAISALTARGKTLFRKLFINITPFIIIISIILMILVYYLSPIISIKLLKNNDAELIIRSLIFIIPFVTISSILRGYYFGKEKMMVYNKASIIEQLIRLLIILIVLPKVIKYGTTYALFIFLVLGAIPEISSIIIFLKNAPQTRFRFEKPIFNLDITKEILSLGIPSTMGKMIGSLLYFIEPIIIIFFLSKAGYSNSFILNEYGTFNAYVIPLLMIPSFIVMSLSTALIPEISRAYVKRDYNYIKRKVYKSLLLCLILGLVSNMFVFLFSKELLSFIYNTNEGIIYIRVLAPVFILFNLEGPLSSALSSIDKPKEALKASFIGALIKTISIILLASFKIGIYPLIIGEILSIIITTMLSLYYFRKFTC